MSFRNLTDVYFRGELQHGGDVKKQKIKCRPIRTREIGGVSLSEALHIIPTLIMTFVLSRIHQFSMNMELVSKSFYILADAKIIFFNRILNMFVATASNSHFGQQIYSISVVRDSST